MEVEADAVEGILSSVNEEKSGMSGGADGCCPFLDDNEGEVGICGTEGNDLGGDPGLSLGGGGNVNLESKFASSLSDV